MDTKHLGQKQLAERWHISEASLERWRTEGIGPQFLKLPGRVLYRMVDIEAFEESCLSTSTKALAGSPSPNQLRFSSPVQINKHGRGGLAIGTRLTDFLKALALIERHRLGL